MNIGLTFLGILLFLTSVFMMLLILVQRGKGGGLTGALGGMGGQSAFGAKAGDVFTRITVVTAIIWITLCMITIAAYNPPPRDIQTKKQDIPSMSSTDEDDADEAAAAGEAEQGEAEATGSDEPQDLDAELEDMLSDEPESPAGEDNSNSEDRTSTEDREDIESTESNRENDSGSDEAGDGN